MGADIHIFLEKFSDEDYIGPKPIVENRENIITKLLDDEEIIFEKRWITADKWEWEWDSDYSDKGAWCVPYQNSIYSSRNYIVFEILADVRSGSYDICISPPRGLPDDISYPYKTMLDYWGTSAHSHSYFTLKELQDVDFDDMLENLLTDDIYYIKIAVGQIREIMEKMSKIDSNPEHVRICFFFDN